MLENDRWICHVCKSVREDSEISVHTFEIRDFECGTRNVRYCNDRPSCYDGALALQASLNYTYKTNG